MTDNPDAEPLTFEVIPLAGNLNRLAAECHAANQHWWHDPATGQPLDRNVGEMVMLMVSEVSEAMEGERKGLMDDKLPHRPMPEVELADVLIRIFDFAGAKGYDLDRLCAAVRLPPMPQNRGEALLQIVAALVPIEEFVTRGRFLAWSIALTMRYAWRHGYDLDGAVAEKREFNRHRADHKPEARLAPGGKKW